MLHWPSELSSGLPESSRELSPCTWSDDATALMEHRLPSLCSVCTVEPLSGASRGNDDGLGCPWQQLQGKERFRLEVGQDASIAAAETPLYRKRCRGKLRSLFEICLNFALFTCQNDHSRLKAYRTFRHCARNETLLCVPS